MNTSATSFEARLAVALRRRQSVATVNLSPTCPGRSSNVSMVFKSIVLMSPCELRCHVSRRIP